MQKLEKIKANAVFLLKELIRTESFSQEESATAGIIADFFADYQIEIQRKHNNLWARNKFYDPALPALLLNSHHDTVRPNDSWTLNPFEPLEKNGRLFGLGSNDAGGSLISLIVTFLHFYSRKDLKFNLIIAATGEEENSGFNGIESILSELGPVELAIIGEPTGMKMAVAEKGLMVLDCFATGKAGHAARREGENAITNAIADIQWFQNYKFDKESDLLGPVMMTVTMITAGHLHNIIPDSCHFTVDVRSTDCYTHEEIVDIIQKQVRCEIRPRSLRLRPSRVDPNHPVVHCAERLNIITYGSPTTSDQAVIPMNSVKMGPGESRRSHTADEFIYLAEIYNGIDRYIKLLNELNKVLFTITDKAINKNSQGSVRT